MPIRPDATWEALRANLPGFIAETETRAQELYRETVRATLVAGGIDEESPLLKALAGLTPDVQSFEFQTVAVGPVGNYLRTLAEQARIARDLERMCDVIEEYPEDDTDPWELFWDDVRQAFPQPPEAALQLLGAFSDSAQEAAADPERAWPLILTGETEDALIGLALDGLAARAGLERSALPNVPAMPPRPVMIWRDEAHAIAELYTWLHEREAWARVFGRLVPAFANNPHNQGPS